MTEDPIWQPLQAELARWIHANRSARFWLRDDDTVEPTAALDRLLQLADDFKVPTALAVIPVHTGEPLVKRLETERWISVLAHGWSHENHAAKDKKKQELGPDRPRALILEQLRDGCSRLAKLHPSRFVPVLVPPWNRIDPALLPYLGDCGFEALSVFGAAKPAANSLPAINTHVDLMDWHGTRGCRDHAELVAAIVTELRQRFDGSAEPIGILTHHLVHDESAWIFLKKLFQVVAKTPGGRWLSISELMKSQKPRDR
ncbi:polysaccharide deacetylase family protein [Phyllobacterium meliloti]|uniref:polysaccharide deacetylase family protein n=1 Tax=Phyllobacterium meliloti TaxID=555317 RepID=UPI001D1528A6|nr:polysaccharide deacetylase family protein [Phyllobacterium sp. T1293]UGX88623.1 polysaccharide deacetylase family protein [Phyllobacterium sp. T1293]